MVFNECIIPRRDLTTENLRNNTAISLFGILEEASITGWTEHVITIDITTVQMSLAFGMNSGCMGTLNVMEIACKAFWQPRNSACKRNDV
jgi:hypothetical protein